MFEALCVVLTLIVFDLRQEHCIFSAKTLQILYCVRTHSYLCIVKRQKSKDKR